MEKTFSVAMRGRDPKGCDHAWVNTRGFCVQCGELQQIELFPNLHREEQMEEGNSTGVICVMDSTGDTKTRWRRDDPVSVQAARAVFDSAVARKEVPFRTAPNPAKLTEFDPDASEIVTVRQYVGG